MKRIQSINELHRGQQITQVNIKDNVVRCTLFVVKEVLIHGILIVHDETLKMLLDNKALAEKYFFHGNFNEFELIEFRQSELEQKMSIWKVRKQATESLFRHLVKPVEYPVGFSITTSKATLSVTESAGGMCDGCKLKDLSPLEQESMMGIQCKNVLCANRSDGKRTILLIT